MGGDDWASWIEALESEGLVRPGFRTIAFDYIGPEATHQIYRSGTIGQAKEHLEATARELDARLAANGGGAWCSVNAAAVTQSSAAIPAVPLYLSLLLRVADASGTSEDPTQQMLRLFDDFVARPTVDVDPERRIRLDDWELSPKVQAEIDRRWRHVTTENLVELGDFPEFKTQFRRLFGFDVLGVDYTRPLAIDLPFPQQPDLERS